MNHRVSSGRRARRSLIAAFVLVAAGSFIATGAAAAPPATASGTVLQTNLVSDLPGAAATLDPNLVNAWGISSSGTSPFWISDNGAGVSTLYQVPGAGNTLVSTVPLVVDIPTPVDLTGGTPTGTVFNPDVAGGAFRIMGPSHAGGTSSAPALFLFTTEDGTIAGWNPGIDPTGEFAGPNGASEHAVIAVDSSGNNFSEPDPALQTGAVYKALAVATSTTPIIPGDANSTALLYVSNFRAGTIEVYDANLDQVTALPADAFRDPDLPAGYAPFNVQVLNGKVYVTYALQDANRHDDVAGPHHGFVDVFNLDGTAGLSAGAMRLISRGALDSPWGLAIAPPGFAGIAAPDSDAVLLVGNFGDGLVNAFDAATGDTLGRLVDPDGEPIQIDGLWALRVGNDGAGGLSDTVYFTAGSFDESHGLFGSLATVAAGSPEGPAEAQSVQANADVVQLAQAQLDADIAGGAPAAVIKQDTQTLKVDSHALMHVQHDFDKDTVDDATP
jgi:uncharacterized protein (TIGR03118 family)